MSEAYPLFPARLTQPLDGVWDFAWMGDSATPDDIDPRSLACAEVAAVPGVFDTGMPRRHARGVGVYRRRVACDGGLKRLTVGGLGLRGCVFWDGRQIGTSDIPYAEVSFDFDTTAGWHDLHIAVDNRFTPGKPELFHAFADFYGFGGIYRSVTLQSLPARRIERVVVTTLDIAAGRVQLALRVAGQPDGDIQVAVGFDESAPEPVRLQVRGGQATLDRVVPGFRLWSPDHPHLHTVSVSLSGDTVVERFGIRTIATRGQDILLNGAAVRLVGVNRHESHPELGPVQPDHLAIDDLGILKDLGCNFIRCVHYQQSPAFLDACDRMGFLVWEESIGWGNPEADALDPATVAMAVEATELMVRRNINNPSIVFWAFLNEGCDNSAAGKRWYGQIADAIRAIDRSRLVSFASMHQERGLCFEQADVIAINAYPGWFSGPEACHRHYLDTIRPEIERLAAVFSRPEHAGKPLIVTEIGTCALWGCHDYGRAQWSEEFQSDYVGEACRAILGNARYAGIALWQMFDAKSYVNTGAIRGKPRGMNCAGLLDEYRRPKLAFQTVRDLFWKARTDAGSRT